MNPPLTQSLDRLVPAFADEPRRWDDVLRRAESLSGEPPARRPAPVASPRPGRVRIALAFALAAALLAVAAPAFGLHRTLLDFFVAEPATERTVLHFESLDRGAPEGMETGVIATETRAVTRARFRGAERTLWVAPTQEGGYCALWERHGGGCDRLGTVPLDVTWAGPEVASADTAPDSWQLVTGHVDLEYVATVEVRLSDRTVARPPIVWVSAPIEAGFFAYEVAEERDATITAVVALDSEGRRIAESTPLGHEPGVPRDALVAERSAAVLVDTRSGEAVVWAAPTRYEGRCAWLEVAGRATAVAPCLPKGYDRVAGAGFRFYPTHETVLLVGRFGERYARVELTFADGTRRAYEPRDGYLLAEVPPEQLAGRSAVSELATYDAAGREIFRVPVDETGNRCQTARPLPAGHPPCP
ncbi:MAG: hypothetical protein ICV64_01035 [Thermoleophilia bacterium]|nr:hypothetical protein [Thermoleophilia bacterium]